MYSIYVADMNKATNITEIGRRPVVVLKTVGNYAYVVPLTTRNKKGVFYTKMDSYIISGLCNCNRMYVINNKYLKERDYRRDCTTGEIKRIEHTIHNLKSIGLFEVLKFE